MADKPDGGPAFPCMAPENIHPGATSGMDLRDWFAGQVVSCVPLRNWSEFSSNEEIISAWAHCAYAVADALIAERDK